MDVVKKILWFSPFSTVKGESVDQSHDSFSELTQQKRVFLSFRGEDTRDNFVSHLRAEFRRKQIEVYIDDESLPRGEEISQALINAIEESALAVIIFSVNYADSSWCLDELAHIFRCRKSHGMFVIPVFYNVDPSDVRNRKGDFEISLNRIKKPGKDRLQKWRDALTAAANLSGWDSSTYRNDAELVEIIVGNIMQKLRGEPTVDFTGEGLIGFPERLKVVESKLNISSDNARIIGIGGMGGIGKTTLAKTVYRRISFLFDACCFIENVGDKWKEGRGACKLQDKLISDLFPGEKVQYITFDYTRLKSKKVLIVLDDVDDSRQLDVITGGRNRYGPKSRIILTSRDGEAFVGLDDTFIVPKLSTDEALELFQSKAFEINPLTEDQIKLSRTAVRDYDFNPLALTTLASTLRGKKYDRWRGILEEMRENPDDRVHRILKLSYDGLGGNKKFIFLDIACFFNGESRDLAERILNGSGFYAGEGIEDLIQKYLLNIVDPNKLWMQRLIEAMGREVVRRESVAEPGERSRLWNPQDLCHVFEHNSETNKIEGISLDMFRIDMVDVSPAVFSNMYKLRVLKFHSYSSQCKLKFPPHEEQLHSLPKNLRYLYWVGYPFISLPSEFTGPNLVELKMQSSKLERLWEGVQNLECLRVLDLSFSKQLIEIPNLSRATKVESVCLRGCDRVREVPQYFEHLEHLNSLDLQDCSSLETVSALPRNIADVNLSCCVSLRSLPNNITTLNDRLNLRLRGCSSFEYNPEILAFLRDVE